MHPGLFEHDMAPREFVADGLCLRAYREGDGAALQRATVESYEHLKPWMPWARPDLSLAEAEATVRRLLASYLRNEDFTLGVWMEDVLVGGTGFHLRVGGPETRNAEVGMWIHGSHAGEGLGTRVLRLMLEWGFTGWPWERLVWKCEGDNLASRRVAEKCGLTLEGTLRKDRLNVAGERVDTCVFAMLRSEWVGNRYP